jgi:hypothetical protein
MQKQLEEQVASTAALVADWKRTVADITTQVNVAGLALSRAKKARETHALQSARGDAVAIKAIASARSEQLAAEQVLTDLKIALPEAEAQLAAAQKNAESACRALSKFEAEILIRQLIDIDGKFDQANAVCADLYGERQKLVNQIVNLDTLPRSIHGGTDHEGAMGLRRVRASLPAFFAKELFRGALHDEMRIESLKIADARYWGLPPEQLEKVEKVA